MKSSIHKIIALATIATTYPAVTAHAADVSIAVMNYATGQATAYAVKQIAEEALGLDVEMVAVSSYPVVWEAMARGDRQIDILPDVWLPPQSELVKKFVDEAKKVRISEQSYEGKQGFCTLRSTAEEHGIHTIFDLATPDIAKLLDRNGDGKGDLYIGAPGWLSTNINKVKLRDYDLDGFYNIVTTDEAIATADLDASAKSGKAWVGYCYSRHLLFAKYDLVWVSEPAYDPKSFVMVQPDGHPDWMEASHVASAFPPQAIHMAWSKSLADHQPQLVKLLERIELDPKDVDAWNLAISEGQDPDEIAKNWVEAHKNRIAEWAAE